MNIISVEYLAYVFLATVLFYITPHKIRNIYLLCISVLFYYIQCKAGIWALFLTCLVSWIVGMWIYRIPKIQHKKRVLSLYIIGQVILMLMGRSYSPIMLLGISFYSFSALSYTIDMYNGRYTPEKSLLRYGVFLSFFPKVSQGPIVSEQAFISEICRKVKPNYDRIKHGSLRILAGFIKKAVIADRLKILVDFVYGDVFSYKGAVFWIASVFYSFQIYADFSGYTDIAIGTAELFGIQLSENFRAPYLAQSITDFWRRWHISLTNWFRDYLYIPLGGNRVRDFRWGINMMVVFLVSGLWHGSSWNFIVWGGIHGLFQISERYCPKLRKRDNMLVFWKGFNIIKTFMLVNFAWILFRIRSFKEFKYILVNIFIPSFQDFHILDLGMNKQDMIFSIVMIVLLILVDVFKGKYDLYEIVQRMHFTIRWTLYLLGIFSVILFGYYGDLTEGAFVYFAF